MWTKKLDKNQAMPVLVKESANDDRCGKWSNLTIYFYSQLTRQRLVQYASKTPCRKWHWLCFSNDKMDLATFPPHNNHLLLSPYSSLNSQTMLDHRLELTGNRHESGGDTEFSFWCSSKTTSSEHACDKLGGSEGKCFGCEHSPLDPCKCHHCCSVSPTSRSKAIAEGRKELMQMIQDMPESSFELSFQDMVDQQQVKHENFIDNMAKDSSNEAHIGKQNKNKKKKNNSNKPDQILRVESMDSEPFLLKMFFPTLSWFKKVNVGNVSKLSPTPSFRESRKHVGKEQRIKKTFQAGDSRSNVKDTTSGSTNNSCNRSKKSRHVM